MKKWLTIQLGSREHFAIPRALEKNGALAALLTDSWVPIVHQPLVRHLSASLALRHHEDIPDNTVHRATLSRIACDANLKLQGIRGWEAIVKRNRWFQEWAARQVCQFEGEADICFAYSYAARLPFRAAKKKGMLRVLGQVDPGPIEQDIVEDGTKDYVDLLLPEEVQPPSIYWEEWREEVDLADHILVNSEWSRDLLIRQNINESKISIIPLMYEGGTAPLRIERSDHNEISVLFLGQVILRKGVGQYFDAIRKMQLLPFRFIFAGPIGVKIPVDIQRNPNVRFLGPVDRQTARDLYRQCDLFILPTLSDGFALTQLEALANGLPVIASRACGRVVTNGKNGLLLDAVTPDAIVRTLGPLCDKSLLSSLKQNAFLPDRYGLASVYDSLASVLV